MDSKALNRPYLFIVIGLTLLFPAASIGLEILFIHPDVRWVETIGKWLVFWTVGVRLFTAGVRQVLDPSFTAKTVFQATHDDSLVVVRELGVANICLGALGLLSLMFPTWRVAAAFVGGLFFANAGLQHLGKKLSGPDEAVAMVSDLFIAAAMVACLWIALAPPPAIAPPPETVGVAASEGYPRCGGGTAWISDASSVRDFFVLARPGCDSMPTS